MIAGEERLLWPDDPEKSGQGWVRPTPAFVEAKDGEAPVVPDPLQRPVDPKRLIVTRGKLPIKSAVPRPGLRSPTFAIHA